MRFVPLLAQMDSSTLELNSSTLELICYIVNAYSTRFPTVAVCLFVSAAPKARAQPAAKRAILHCTLKFTPLWPTVRRMYQACTPFLDSEEDLDEVQPSYANSVEHQRYPRAEAPP